MEVMVSVICLAYNHEAKIKAALEGFVSQKTNFLFEVIIHDDASSDKTADIIREYEQKYPHIIKPIYQVENQYSKGVDIIHQYMLPKARGKYYALCEGDDSWINQHKLQKQFDYMEAHPQCMLCGHRAKYQSTDGLKWISPTGEVASDYFPLQNESRNYSVDDLVREGGGSIATASFFMRRKVLENQPFRSDLFGDYQLTMFAAILGECHCLQDVMSVYNYSNNGSFSKTFLQNKEFRIQVNQTFIDLLKSIDEYTDYNYSESIREKIRYHTYHVGKYLDPEKVKGPEFDEYRLQTQRRKAMKEKLLKEFKEAHQV